MVFRSLPLRLLSSLRLAVLMLFFVVSSSAVSDAGVMISPTETGMVALAIPVIPADADDNKRQVFESSHQDYGMTVTSSGGGGSTVPAVIDSLDHSADPQLVQWLVSQGRVVIPNPIPICLLKVPIVVA